MCPPYLRTSAAAVKSFKSNVKKILGKIKLNFEEFSTVLAQVETCLNSRPLTPLPDRSDTLEVLTPGHFLIGRPLTALPDEVNNEKVTPLRRWKLCQALVKHLWTRWSSEYVQAIWKVSKWHTLEEPARGEVAISTHYTGPSRKRWKCSRGHCKDGQGNL